MTNFKDVFISYGRTDSKEFAIRLKQRLVENGLSVWLDLSDIPLGIDFQKNIDDSLQKAHNFLFIISPHAINSPYCALELESALLFKKRIIPLMHVQEISQETWQKRNPESTDSDWKQYQAEGRHSSHTNMHPAIKKLNWALFEEGINDFELATQDLVKLVNTETDYIHTHTQLLNQALTWINNQRQTRYLLTGKSCQRAKDWLLSNNDLVSCKPSNLHCDFISQSIKNTHNLMCHVFLAYAEEDIENADKIRRSLIQHAYTVWTNRTDILTGEDFDTAINRGIEQADNLIFLISPEAIASPYCQNELNYALSLNKRIIPILSQPTDDETIPETIRTLQWVTLTNNAIEEDYLADESEILNVLKRDAPYHEDHKNLLVKALKWQRQEDNPSILLKGQNLSHYTTWLKLAQKRELYGPTELQEKLVTVSSQQSPDITVNVFIIFASADLDFARKLNETLQIQGQSTWFEQESLAPEADYDEEIQSGITASENVAFILSPDALNSEKCKKMFDYASTLNKRISTILYDNHQKMDVPEYLKDFPLFDFRLQEGDFLSNFGKLYRAFESQPQHIREHTKLLVKALEWEREDRDDSLLLRGRYLKTAKAWLDNAQDNKPKPIDLQRQYIQTSHELPLRRIRPISVVLFGVATTLIVTIARIIGLLRGIELATYDHLLHQRRDEAPDDRFTLIEVDRQSGIYLREQMINGDYEPGIGTIPDEALLEIFEKLTSYQPKLIGLDFYRDFAVKIPEDAEKTSNLEEILHNDDTLVSVCKSKIVPRRGENDPSLDLGGFPAIDGLPSEKYSGRIGFNDVLDDRDGVLRRHYLVKEPDSEYCPVSSAFSLVLAQRYLEMQASNNQSALDTSLVKDLEGMVKAEDINQRTIPKLTAAGGQAGGLYTNDFELGGYQTLLNFRTFERSPKKFADSISLKDFLTNNFSGELIEDRIILIGITDYSDKNVDSWKTPFGDIPGVFIHGQMASQLISAAIDNRPLIWWLSLKDEILWMFAWSVVGGFTVWGFYRPLPLALAAGGGILLIYAVSRTVMIFATGLVPMVPAIATLLMTGGIVIYRNYRLRKV